MNLSTHEPAQDLSSVGVPSHIGIGVDGYTPIPAYSYWQQAGKYKIPLMSPSRGKTIRRHDGVEEISVRPNVDMSQTLWKAPSRGKIVTQTGGLAQQPLNSYAAGQVDVNSFLANSDISALAAAQFVNGKSPRFSTTAGD